MRLIDKDELLHELKRRSDVAAEARMTLIAEDFIDLVNDADVVEVPRWISVTERLPQSGEHDYVLVCATCKVGNLDYQNAVTMAFVGEEGFIDVEMDAVLSGVTHWMPLPKPPEVG